MSESMQLTTIAGGVPAAPDVQLSALNPMDMQSCQVGLIEWCRRKIMEVSAEAQDLWQAYETAKAKKWKSSTLQRHAALAKKRLTFYEKIKAALEAGYIIVPNFPVTLFAIRTDKDKPAQMYRIHDSSWKPKFNMQQEAKELPVGEGEYQNPLPSTIEESEKSSDGKGGIKTQWHCSAEDWKEIDFPINMAKAHLMEATDDAMKKKIFDELGILPSPYKKKDPLIVGRIRDPKASKFDRDGCVTFIIAWYLDTRTL